MTAAAGSGRYDVRPLLDRFDNDAGRLAAQAGVTHRTVNRWIEAGGVPEEEADRVAIRCGTHPGCLWPDEWIERGLALIRSSEQLGLFEVDW